jgi:hypothetical protein
MVAGSMYWQTDRQKRKEFDAVVAEKKAKEKNAAWIRELEARDQEDKEIRAARDARRQAAAGKKEQPPTVLSSVVEESEERKGILESMGNMLWGKK